MNYRRSHHPGCSGARDVTLSRSRARYGRAGLRSCSDHRCDSLRRSWSAFRSWRGCRCLHSGRGIVCSWTVVGCRRRRWRLSLGTLRANQNQQEYINEGNSFHVLKCNQLIQDTGRALGLRFADAVGRCQQMRGYLAGGKSKRSRDRSPGSEARNLLSGLIY
jgi:hypothetical protein